MRKLNLGSYPIRIITLTVLVLASSLCALGQSSGHLKGTVRGASGAAVSGVTVVATNQVTGKWKRMRSSADGLYSFRLVAGAYRLRVAAPNAAP